MSRCQFGWSGYTAADQDAGIKPAKMRDLTNQAAFGLPTSNRCGIDGGQTQGIGQTVGVLLHQVIDVRHLQSAQSCGGNGIDRRCLIDGAVDRKKKRRNRGRDSWWFG